MSKKSLYNVGLVAAILSAVSWFVFVYGQLNLPDVSTIDDPLQLFQKVEELEFGQKQLARSIPSKKMQIKN